MSTFQFLDAGRANHPVARLCRVLGVSGAGFYAWQGRWSSARATRARHLALHISDTREASRSIYGVPRIHAVLAREGMRVGKKRLARLTRVQGNQNVSRWGGCRSLTKTNPAAPKAPDHVGRKLSATAPNQLWITDIACIEIAEGLLHLAIVVGMWSRRIVGWSMRDDLTAPLAVDALQMAASRPKPKPAASPLQIEEPSTPR